MRGMFDARVNVYRIDDNSSNPGELDLGEVGVIPTLIHSNCRATFQMSVGGSRDEGPGSRDGGQMVCFIEKKFAINDHDILRIMLGPEQSSEYWLVKKKFTPSNARWHRELTIEPYIGAKPR